MSAIRPEEEFDALLASILSGAFTPQERGRFNALLRSHPEWMDCYFDQKRVDFALSRKLSSRHAVFAAFQPRFGSTPWLKLCAAALVVLLAGGFALTRVWFTPRVPVQKIAKAQPFQAAGKPVRVEVENTPAVAPKPEPRPSLVDTVPVKTPDASPVPAEPAVARGNEQKREETTMNIHAIAQTAVMTGMVAAAAVTGATEYFVDCTRPNDAGDGLTESTAKRTLQAAVNLAAAGDTVTVLPGVYQEGVTWTASSSNRVVITKAITLRSRDGVSATHIVGQWDPNAVSGLGTNAIRCLCISGVAATVKGFTIRDGASRTDYNAKDGYDQNRGGGILCLGNSILPKVIDCVVSNCAATRGGGIFFGTAYQCLFTGNRASGNGAAARHSSLFNCVITRNTATVGSTQTGVSIVAYARVVNCTIADNDGMALNCCGGDGNTGFGPVLNSILVRNTYTVDVTSFCSNCLLTSGTTRGGNNIFETSPQLAGPAVDDWRLLAGSAAVGAGDTNHLAYMDSALGATDFYGNPRRKDGKVSLGAIEASVPICGMVNIRASSDATVSVNGIPLSRDTYVAFTAWPTQFQIAAQSTIATNSLLKFYANGITQWPLMDDSMWFLPSNGATDMVFAVCAVAYHTDPVNGSDETGDGSTNAPFKTLQKAIDSSSGNTVILAGSGVYGQGGRYMASHSNRVAVTDGLWRRIKAVEGPEKTFIAGAPDPDNPVGDGGGTNAVRCVYLNGGVFQGFTLTGGYGGVSMNDSDGDQVRGGGMFSSGSGGHLLDCVVSNCVASRGAVGWGGNLFRCRLLKNKGTNNGITRGLNLYNTLIVENECVNNILGQGTLLFGCTVTDNKGTVGLSENVDGKTRAYNSIFYGAASGWDAEGKACLTNCLLGTAVSFGTLLQENVLRQDPLYVDSSAEDYRLMACSPAIGYGNAAFYAPSQGWADINGNPLRFTNGGVTLGALQTTVAVVKPVATSDRGISPSGPILLTSATNITFTATDAGTRNFLYFEVDGVRQSDSGTTIVLPFSPEDPERVFTVKAVYQDVFYVDAVNGDDSRSGLAWDTATRTLQATVDRCIDSDTVIAAPGNYNEGSGLQTVHSSARPGEPYIRSRVVITNNITLKSRDGAKTTFITGAAATQNADEYGRGPDAVRCVTMLNTGTLQGFTITGGRTDCVNTETNDNNHGGGVLSPYPPWDVENKALVMDCVISNNASMRGGGSRFGRYVNCKFFGNRADANGGASRDGDLYQCLVAGNKSVGTLAYCQHVDNCTLAKDNVDLDGGKASVLWSDRAFPVTAKNTLIESGNFDGVKLFNCAYPSDTVLSNVVTNDSPVVGQTALDAAYRPVYSSCVAIDAGDTNYLTAAYATNDLAGTQRIMNSKLDIGCYEYDWRPRYSKDLYKHGTLSVTNVTPWAEETANGAVLLKEGTLAAVWRKDGMQHTYSLSYRVTGTGTLKVSVNGKQFDTVAVSEKWTSQTFTSNLAENTLTFTYAPGPGDNGGALLGNFKITGGTVIMLR